MSNLASRICETLARKSWRFYHTVNTVIEQDGFKIPLVFGNGLYLTNYPTGMEKLLRSALQGRSGTVVDIGANIGAVIQALFRIDPKIPYIGFEPSPSASHYLQRLIKINGLSPTHTAYPVALSDFVGAAELMSSSDSDVSGTITNAVRPESMYKDRIAVCVTKGDLVLKDCEKIALIKIDAEGSEPQILNGLQETIKKHRPVFIIEVVPFSHLEDNSYDRRYFGQLPDDERIRLVNARKLHHQRIESFFTELNYLFFNLTDGKKIRAKPDEATLEDPDFVVIPAEQLNGEAQVDMQSN